MPLYEYQCPQCGRFERIRKFSDPALTECPTCGREVQKLLSAPAIQFKGTGWYITDYARKAGGDNGGGAKEGSGDSKSDSKSGSKATESKAEAKSESKAETSSPTQSTSKKDSAASGSSPTK